MVKPHTVHSHKCSNIHRTIFPPLGTTGGGGGGGGGGGAQLKACSVYMSNNII